MPLKAETDIAGSMPQNPFQPLRSMNHNEHGEIIRNTGHAQRPTEQRLNTNPTENRNGVALNPLGAKDIVAIQAERRDKARWLKMDVPNTLETTKSRAYQQEGSLRAQTPPNLPFDDTTTLSFDDGDSLQDGENPTMVFRGEPDQLFQSHLQTSASDWQHENVIEPSNNILDYEIELGDNWQEEVQAERAIQEQEQNLRAGRFGNLKDTHTGQQYRGQFPAEQELFQASKGTPSRSRKAPPVPGARSSHLVKTVSFRSPGNRDSKIERVDSPDLELPSHNATPIPTQARQQQLKIGGGKQDHGRVQNTLPLIQGRPPPPSLFESSRASDYPTSSEDELPPDRSKLTSPAPVPENDHSRITNKRDRDDVLDYDLTKLKRMKYQDLVREEFDKDPKSSRSSATSDNTGNSVSLSQSLESLGKMSEEEQKAMFRRHDDDQWTQIGSWFIEKFQEDLKRLIAIRCERRKISMRFENEIHKRQKDIEWHSASIDTELKGLKRGGGELIKGKEIPSRRGTPLRK